MVDLKRQRILIVRSPDDIKATADKIQQAGGIAVAFPVIECVEPADHGPLDKAIQTLGTIDWVFFTSAHSIQFFCQRINSLGLSHDILQGCSIAVIGPATCRKVDELDLTVTFSAERSTAVDFFHEFAQTYQVEGKRFLLPFSNIAHRTLPDLLTEHGGNVTEVTAYCNVPVKTIDREIVEQLKRGEIDWVLFTSPSTVRNLLALLEDYPSARKGIRAASIGPSTSKAIQQAGLEPALEAEKHTLDGLIEAIANYQ